MSITLFQCIFVLHFSTETFLLGLLPHFFFLKLNRECGDSAIPGFRVRTIQKETTFLVGKKPLDFETPKLGVK